MAASERTVRLKLTGAQSAMVTRAAHAFARLMVEAASAHSVRARRVNVVRAYVVPTVRTIGRNEG